jgi:uncharacterized membrane protein YoaT (DUF817 family)
MKKLSQTDILLIALIVTLIVTIIITFEKENKVHPVQEYHLIGCNDYRCILRVDKQYFVVNKKEFYGDKTDNAQ